MNNGHIYFSIIGKSKQIPGNLVSKKYILLFNFENKNEYTFFNQDKNARFSVFLRIQTTDWTRNYEVHNPRQREIMKCTIQKDVFCVVLAYILYFF